MVTGLFNIRVQTSDGVVDVEVYIPPDNVVGKKHTLPDYDLLERFKLLEYLESSIKEADDREKFVRVMIDSLQKEADFLSSKIVDLRQSLDKALSDPFTLKKPSVAKAPDVPNPDPKFQEEDR